MLDGLCHQQESEFIDKPVTVVPNDSVSEEPVCSPHLSCSDKNTQDFAVPNLKIRLKENVQFSFGEI